MKRYDSDDELDRALFALPLEEPPANLRHSILAATVYGPPVPAPVRPWELWLLGGALALIVWLCIAIFSGAGAATLGSLDETGASVLAFFSQPTTLFWIAVGGGAAFWLSQTNLTLAPGYRRTARR